MRIAQVSPLYESVPPRRYGGTERIVHYLTEELVRRGHRVTLFAAGDSQTAAELRPACPGALYAGPAAQDPCAYHVHQLGMVYASAAEFDLIHSHAEFRALPLSRLVETPTLSTNHNRLDVPDALALSRAYPEAYLTSVSQSQRAPLPQANWVATVYNGIPVESFPFSSRPGEYLVFLGRLSPEKGPADAIEVAQRVGLPLRIAAKVNHCERGYFEQVLRPLLDHPLVEFLGEVGDAEKASLLVGARALLFPVRWPEPFGLASVEAMACGTPVLAYPSGAVAEVVADGVTGFLCRDVADMADRCREVDRLARWACRERVERRFSVRRMVDDYELAYRRVLETERRALPLVA